MYFHQRSFSKKFSVSGIGLHSGVMCSVEILPAPENHGIEIQPHLGSPIRIESAVVSKTPRCTRLGDENGMTIDTPEHLLAALVIAGVDNCKIRFSGPEVPILDGCAEEWLLHFFKAGIRHHAAPISAYTVSRTFEFRDADTRYIIAPGAPAVDVTIDFPHPFIGIQSSRVSHHEYRSLASSRTFVLDGDIAKLQAAGLALGGSLDNALVISDAGPVNPQGFRFANECARHKALDLLGDLYVLGAPLHASIKAYKPGHAANAALVSALIESGVLVKTGQSEQLAA